MSRLIDSDCEFSSPSGFPGSEKIEVLAAGRAPGSDRWLATGGW